MSDEKKKKLYEYEHSTRRFLRKYMLLLYFVSIALCLAYLIVVIIMNRTISPDKLVFYGGTLWILLLAGLGTMISSVLYVSVSFPRAALMLIIAVITLISNLVLLGPVVVTMNNAVAELRHEDHRYFVTPMFGGAGSSGVISLSFIECDSLGIVCDRIETMGIPLTQALDSSDPYEYELQYDEAQNAILWLQTNGEIIYTHGLEP